MLSYLSLSFTHTFINGFACIVPSLSHVFWGGSLRCRASKVRRQPCCFCKQHPLQPFSQSHLTSATLHSVSSISLDLLFATASRLNHSIFFKRNLYFHKKYLLYSSLFCCRGEVISFTLRIPQRVNFQKPFSAVEQNSPPSSSQSEDKKRNKNPLFLALGRYTLWIFLSA